MHRSGRWIISLSSSGSHVRALSALPLTRGRIKEGVPLSNPTGTVYLQANPNYVWADGDVYEIVQTDTIEGAASGASFGGLGVVNQPHQMLLNKLGWLKKQSVQGTSDVGSSGWYQFADVDQNLGQISPIVQWGQIVQSGPVSDTGTGPGGGPGNSQLQGTLTVTYPIAFTTAIWSFIISFTLANISTFRQPFAGSDSYGGGDTHYQVLWPPSLTQAQILLKGEDWDLFYGTFFWRAMGY